MSNKYVDLIKDTFIFAIGSLGSKIILFLLMPLYTNYLSVAEYGTAELVFTISQLVIPIATVTIWNGVIRFGLMKGKRSEDVIANGMLVWLAGSLLTILLTPLFNYYPPIKNWKWYLCAYSLAYSANLIELNYLKVKGKNKLYAGISLIQALVLVLLNIILLVFFHIGVAGYLISNIAANLLAAVLIFFGGSLCNDIKTGHFNKRLLKQMVIFSAPLILNDISWWAIHSSDKIMIEAMLTASALGLYTVASKIPGLINTFVNIFSHAWGVSSIKEIESTNDKTYFAEVFRIYSGLAFGASIFFVAIIKPFMHYYVGSEFQGAWRYVPLLLVAASFSAISAYFGSMYGALQKSVECTWSTVLGGIANVILNYMFIKMMGVEGAIVGTVSAFFIIATLRLFGVNRYIKMPIFWSELIIDILLALVEAVLVSLDFHIFVTSIVTIILFVLNHIKDIKRVGARINISWGSK